MRKDEFISLLTSRTKLNAQQVENLARLKKVAERFHRDAGTYDELKDLLKGDITEESLVLESGHQPNFWPYGGVWRKAFLLDYFSHELATSDHGREYIPMFGFADYNLSTAKWLYQNRIPARTRDGFETIGFTISGKDRWKRFDSIDKPSEDRWRHEIERIRMFYHRGVGNEKEQEENLDRVISEMQSSYERGKSFSDINALLFSRICNRHLGLKVLFFRYSDLQREGIFLGEWERILLARKRFNSRYNEIITRNGLDDIGYCSVDSIPFWYHCECGGKVPLEGSGVHAPETLAAGECPVCNERYELNLEGDLKKYFDRMSPTAVARNLVFSEGLGTTLFISGAGGGLRYGIISDDLSREFSFNQPLTLVWRCRDYYLSFAHQSILKDLERSLDWNAWNFYGDDQVVFQRVKEEKEELAATMKRLEAEYGEVARKELKKYKGRYINLDTQMRIASNIFSLIPSMLDLFVSVGFEKVIECWTHVLSNVEITEDRFFTIKRDVIYGDEKLPQIYRNLSTLGAGNRE